MAFGLKVLLCAREHEIGLAHDGLQALERLRRGPHPGLLLLDNDMPELDGYAVPEGRKSVPTLKNLTVLMLTASQIDSAQLSRVSGLLRKPYPRQVLCKMIDQLLAARKLEGSSRQ